MRYLIPTVLICLSTACGAPCDPRIDGFCVVLEDGAGMQLEQRDVNHVAEYLNDHLGLSLQKLADEEGLEIHLVDYLAAHGGVTILGDYDTRRFSGEPKIRLVAEQRYAACTLAHELLHMVADKVHGIGNHRNAAHDYPEFWGGQGSLEYEACAYAITYDNDSAVTFEVVD